MKLTWKIWLYLGLTLLSVLMVGILFVANIDTTLLTQDFLFAISILPLQVGLTTLILDLLLERRVKQERLEKMNMVIGVFFSEVGVELLHRVSPRDADIESIRGQLMVNNQWTPADFSSAVKMLSGHQFKVDMGVADLLETRNLMGRQRSLLVQLLENPILMEHETFTNSLRAVFHMTEELQYRKSIESLPDADIAHLNGDVARAYGLLIGEWVSYLAYLKDNYPYLFSLAVRTNPFDINASPEIKQPVTPVSIVSK